MSFSRFLFPAALLSFLFIVASYHLVISHTGDVQYYADIGDMVEKARVEEGTTFQVEYPPLASALFFFLRKITPGVPFAITWLGFFAFLITGAALYAKKYLPPVHQYSLGIAIVFVTLLLGVHTAIGRYDILIMTLLFLAWKAFSVARYRDSALFLTFAAAFKLIPILLLPTLFIFVPRERWREVLIGILIAAAISFAIPILLFGFGTTIDNIAYMMRFHGERGFEVESLWSGLHMLFLNLMGKKATTEFHHNASHNNDLGPEISFAASLILMLGLVIFYALAWREARKKPVTDLSKQGMFFFIPMWAIAMSPVFSPQYLLWFAPMLFIWIAEKARAERSINPTLISLATTLIFLIAASQWIYPLYFPEFVEQKYLALTLLLNARNFALILSIVLLWKEIWRVPSRT